MKEDTQKLEKTSRTEEAAFEKRVDETAEEKQKWPDTIERIAGQILKNETPDDLVPTGFPDLDQVLKGLRNTDMIVLASRVSMGKSALAMNIAERAALGLYGGKHYTIGIFSLEKTEEELAHRMLFSKAGVPGWKDYFSESDHKRLSSAAEELKKASIVVDDPAWLDITDLRIRARRMKKAHNIDLLIIDSLQQLGDVRNSCEGRKQELGAVSEGIQGLVRELKIPVLVLSQLSRAMEEDSRDGTPQLSDLSDLGAIDQSADVVMLLYRPSYYNRADAAIDDTLAIVDVVKNRHGPVGDVRLNFLRDITRFEDRKRGEDRAKEDESRQRL
jgi:replicative DNA helicase